MCTDYLHVQILRMSRLVHQHYWKEPQNKSYCNHTRAHKWWCQQLFNHFRDLGHNQIGSYHVESFITTHSWSYCKQLISMLLILLAFDVLSIITHHTLSVCSQPWRQWKRLEWFVDLQCRTTRSNLASLEHLFFLINDKTLQFSNKTNKLGCWS